MPLSSRPLAAMLLAGTALAAAPALAQDAQTAQNAPAAAPPLHDRVVVTSSAVRTLEAEALQHIDVLSAEEIAENFNGSLGDTLADLPGVTTTFFGPAAGRPVVRGLGGPRTRVLTNGVGLIDASAASPDHAVTTEGLEAERIEILRGSSALAFGGNAIAGVVNVIDGTVPSARPEGGLAEGLDGQFYAGAASVNDAVNLAGSVTAALGPLVLTAQGVRREAGDYSIPGYAESAAFRAMEEHDHDEEDHDEDHEDEDHEDHEDEDHDHEHEDEEEAYGSVPNSGYEFTSAAFGASVVQDWGFVGLAVKQFDSEYGLPGHSHVHAHEEDEDHEDEDDEEDDHQEDEHAHEEGEAFIDMEQTRVDLRGEVELGWSLFEALRLSGGWSDYAHTEFEAPGEPGTIFNSEGWEGRLELVQPDRDGWTGAAGLQASDADFGATGAEALIPETNTQTRAAFTVQRYDAGGWGLEGGVRLEETEIENAIGARDFTAVSGSAGAFLRPAEGLFLGATLAHTERAPVDAELFADGPHLATGQYEIGDPSLSLEKALSMEGIVRYDAGPVAMEAALWRAAYDGFIFLAPTGLEDDGLPVLQYTQSDADLWGAEAAVSAALFSTGALSVSGDVTVEYTNGEIEDGPALPRIPPLSATLGLDADIGEAWSLRAELVAVDEQDRLFPGETATEAYEMVNLRAVWRPMTEQDLSVIASVRNVTDEEGRVHASYLKDLLPLPGRSFRLALRAGF